MVACLSGFKPQIEVARVEMDRDPPEAAADVIEATDKEHPVPGRSTDLFELDLREERRGFASDERGGDVEVGASRWLKGGVVADLVPGGRILEVERAIERLGRTREERLDQDGDDANGLGQA